MTTQIFVNLVVKNLPKSIEFFTKLGFTFNKQFTDETATCMIISDTIYAMLLTEPKFKSFTKKKLIDPKTEVQVLNALSFESKNKVDEIVENAIKAGATNTTTNDHGFMYTRTFDDLDGHTWEIFWMDPTYVHKT